MPTQCDQIAAILPEVVDAAEPADPAVRRHVEECDRCRAELARYDTLLRGLQLLRTQYLEPAPGLLAATLATLTAAGERRTVTSVLTRRRMAYAGAVAGALAAAGTTTAALLVARARRRTLVA